MHRVLVAMDFVNSTRAKQKKGLTRLDRQFKQTPIPKFIKFVKNTKKWRRT